MIYVLGGDGLIAGLAEADQGVMAGVGLDGVEYVAALLIPAHHLATLVGLEGVHMGETRDLGLIKHSAGPSESGHPRFGRESTSHAYQHPGLALEMLGSAFDSGKIHGVSGGRTRYNDPINDMGEGSSCGPGDAISDPTE